MKENYTQNFVTILTSLLWHSSLHLKKLHSAYSLLRMRFTIAFCLAASDRTLRPVLTIAIGTNSHCDDSPAYLTTLWDVANSATAPIPREMKLPGRSQQWCKTPSHPTWETFLRATESTPTPLVAHREIKLK